LDIGIFGNILSVIKVDELVVSRLPIDGKSGENQKKADEYLTATVKRAFVVIFFGRHQLN
jgi:hypothetical protein